MKLVELSQAAAQGPREEMQDFMAVRRAPNGAYVLGIFDGHGLEGAKIAAYARAHLAAQVEGELKRPLGARHCATLLGRSFKQLHEDLRDDQAAQASGTTATVGVVTAGQLAVAYLGDSQAYYYPDHGPTRRLGYPHTVDNSWEVNRVSDAGYAITDGRFDGVMQISRAIGDYVDGFMSHDAQVTDTRLSQPGTIVIASDGVWGKDNHASIEKLVRHNIGATGYVANLLAEHYAPLTQDNASAIVARVQ